MIVGGILSPLERFFRSVLIWLHVSVGLPWAWAIVGLTIIVRAVLVPLMVRQIHSMQALQMHAPEIKALQQKWKHDKARQNEELMKFYRENNINPAASCLPLAAQIPVFIGLYYTLRTFAKHPPPGDLSWLGFVPDISRHVTSHWSGYLLLAVYVASQLASTYFMGGTMQQSQRILMYILPFAFIFVIARFPTGLVLYWMTTNLWTVGQGLVTRRLAPKPVPPPKRTSRTPPKQQADGADGAKPSQPAAKPTGQPRVVRRKKKRGGARR